MPPIRPIKPLRPAGASPAGPATSAPAAPVAPATPRRLKPLAVAATSAPVAPDLDPVAAMARKSADAAATALRASGKGRDVAGASAVGASVVDILVSDAARAAARAIATPSTDAGAGVWSDTVETLASLGLDPVIYCARSGRVLSRLDAAPWADLLAGVAALGDTRAGDAARERLLGAVLAQMGGTVAPPVLVDSADALALLRDTAPRDYLAISLSRLFPCPPRADTMARAKWAAMLGRVRAGIDTLPPAVLSYCCEVVTLYLSYIHPARLPGDLSLSVSYPGGDWSGCCASVAAAGHLCGRIVQSLFTLLARERQRPVASLSASDLRALRTAWGGVPSYAEQKAARAALRGSVSDAMRPLSKRLSTAAIERLRNAAGLSPEALALDLSDLQIAAAMTGRTVPVHFDSPAAMNAAQAARDAGKARAADLLGGAGVETAEPVFDIAAELMALTAQGMPDAFASSFDDVGEIVGADLWSVDDVVQFDFDHIGDDGEDDESAEGIDDLQAELIAQAMAGASGFTL